MLVLYVAAIPDGFENGMLLGKSMSTANTDGQSGVKTANDATQIKLMIRSPPACFPMVNPPFVGSRP
jgi:hypothetical protein